MALLYSTPCTSFLEDIDADPDGVAMMIKNIILNTGSDNNTLEGITLTGKRLQVDAAINETLLACDPSLGTGVNITSVWRNPSHVGDLVKVFFEVKGDTSSALFDVYTLDGKLITTYPINAAEFTQGYITIRVMPVPSGMYLVTLRNKKEKDTVKLVTGFK